MIEYEGGEIMRRRNVTIKNVTAQGDIVAGDLIVDQPTGQVRRTIMSKDTVNIDLNEDGSIKTVDVSNVDRRKIIGAPTVNVLDVPNASRRQVQQVIDDVRDGLDRPQDIVVTNTEVQFTEQEIAKIKAIVAYLDITDNASISAYGYDIQAGIMRVSDDILKRGQAGEITQASTVIHDIVNGASAVKLSSLAKPNWFIILLSKIFSGVKNHDERINAAKQKFTQVDQGFTAATVMLEDIKKRLEANVTDLKSTYEVNLAQYRELMIYIEAGNQVLSAANVKLQAMADELRVTGDPMLQQRMEDYKMHIERLDKKMHDLRIAKLSAMQTAPQLRLIMTNNQNIADKIQSTAALTIPLWRKAFMMAVSLTEQMKAVQVVNAVQQSTQQALLSVADVTKMTTEQLAQELHKAHDLKVLEAIQSRLLTQINEAAEPSPQQQLPLLPNATQPEKPTPPSSRVRWS